MVMNLYILLLVSLPEAFLNLIIALLITANKRELELNKRNIIKFSATIVLMLFSSCVIRPASPNIITNISLHIIAYTLIFMIVYRMKPVYALFGVSFFLLVVTTTEVLYTPYVITYVFKGMENFQNAYHWYVLLVLPQRIVQGMAVAFLWKREVLLATKINYRFHRLFLASFLVLTLGEQMLYFIYLAIYAKLDIIYQIMFSVSMFIIVLVLNVLLFKLINMVIVTLVKKTDKMLSDFEDDVGYVLGEIRALLVKNEVEEAIKLVDFIKK